MIYSFYGRLSVGTTDVDLLRSGNLPPTFYCYGTRDPFYDQFLANADAAEAAGVSVERLQLDGMPHGFGAQGDWIVMVTDGILCGRDDQWIRDLLASYQGDSPSDLAQRILRQSQDLCQGEDDGTVLAVHLERSRDPLG